MTIRVCKSYQLDQMMFESDIIRGGLYEDITRRSDYNSVFESVDVTEEELLDYIKKGYAIKINC